MTTLSSHKQKLLKEFDIFLTAMDNITDTQRKILKSEFTRAILKIAELTFNEVRPAEAVKVTSSTTFTEGEKASLIDGFNSAVQTMQSNYEEFIK